MSDLLSSDSPHIWVTHKAGLNTSNYIGARPLEQLFPNNLDLWAARLTRFPRLRPRARREWTTIGSTGDGQRDMYHSGLPRLCKIADRR